MSGRRKLLGPRTRRDLLLRYRRTTAIPPVRMVRFGSLRRLAPFSRTFGYDRGQPVDRYYIDAFLRRHAGSAGYAPGVVRGRILEVGEPLYAGKLADPATLESVEVLDASSVNPDATLVGDLTDPASLPEDAFDCVICAQTLHLIYEVREAVSSLHRLAKPGGTVLATLPGMSQICRPDMDIWGDYWRFTTLSARRIFEEVFDPADVTVEAYGNVLSSTAFLYGLAAQDLKTEELDLRDPDYELLIGVRAVKRA